MGADLAAPVEVRLSLALLGPLSARLAGEDLNLGGRRQRAVVALLVLARGRQVSTAGACSTRCGRASRRRPAPPACSPTSPTCAARSSRTGPPGPRAGCSSPAATATRWPRAPSTSTPGASSGWSSRPARRRTRVGASSCSRSRWRCGAARRSADYAGEPGPTPRPAARPSSATLAREQLLEARLDAGESAAGRARARGPGRRGPAARGALAAAGAGAVPRAPAGRRAGRAAAGPARPWPTELGVDPGPALRALERGGARPVARLDGRPGRATGARAALGSAAASSADRVDRPTWSSRDRELLRRLRDDARAGERRAWR